MQFGLEILLIKPSNKIAEFIRVFMRASWRTGYQKLVVNVPPQTTVNHMRTMWAQNFGPENKLQEDDVRNEDGYIIATKDLDLPLSKHSNGCCVNLEYTFTPVISKYDMRGRL
eukprot:m.47777 g.47777  ORF g.47777 m.47777 type:complete len:113 (-) comp15242_c0_seq1:344-682(-)